MSQASNESFAGAVLADGALRLGGVTLKKVKDALASGSSVSSLADLSKPARVEPIMIVDSSIAEQEYMADVSMTALTLFSGYYMQGVAMQMDVGRIDTRKVFDSMNPSRSVGGPQQQFKDAVFSKEHYAGGLPSLEAFDTPAPKNFLVESVDANPTVSQEAKDGQGASVSPDAAKKLYENTNLATGKLVNVELRDGDHTAKLPVLIKLVPTTVTPTVLSHIFTAQARNDSYKERYHLWRGGQISLVRDLMLGIDMIDTHRRTLVNDNSNVYMLTSDRKRNNSIRAGMTGAPSLADASNIAVISKDTAKMIEQKMYGKISNVKVRKKIFDTTYLLMLVVVDEKWERVTIYHRGVDESTDMSFRDLKSSEKGKGPDITDILKAFSMGNTPAL